jgi:curved DNA-binding protein CbpA
VKLPTKRTCYDILDLPLSATADEIKKRFRELIFRFHPDKNQGNAKANELCQHFNHAYDPLSDPAKRRIYDTGLSYPMQMSPTPPHARSQYRTVRQEYWNNTTSWDDFQRTNKAYWEEAQKERDDILKWCKRRYATEPEVSASDTISDNTQNKTLSFFHKFVTKGRALVNECIGVIQNDPLSSIGVLLAIFSLCGYLIFMLGKLLQ